MSADMPAWPSIPQRPEPPRFDQTVLGFDMATGGEVTVVSGYRDTDGVVHIENVHRHTGFHLVYSDGLAHPERLAAFARSLNTMGESPRDGLVPAMAAAAEAMRPVAESVRRASREAAELESARHWPATGAKVCAHVCGPGPGHRCDARASTSLSFALPSGGARELPLCAPCRQAELECPDG